MSFGHISYFNFQLAKDMGLISKDHPHRMTKKLENKLLETFNLRIINEYDLKNKTPYPKKKIKPKTFMATRYLQLQHPNKQGKTSGDGRGIWNGTFKFQGKIWDISSRGTGVTALSPGAVTAQKPLKSGSTEQGYGCGLAEIDELYSSALLSEIFHINKINTERVLCIIDHGKGLGIGVRAGLNLIRPAHLFSYLKQDNYESLKKASDYLIDRQIKNKEWDFSKKSKSKYKNMLDEICYSFAKFTALLERDYIFTWLDWDGDNVLANSGIIDYGSIRPMGLRHDQYRYDDVERYSTNLNEQKTKGRLIIQVFAQLVDYLETKKKKPLKDFTNSPIVKKYKSTFDYFLMSHLLVQVGFSEKQIQFLMLKKRDLVNDFYTQFIQFEKHKITSQPQDTGDGHNLPPAFNMRKSLRILASNLEYKTDQFHITLKREDFLSEILSDFSKEQSFSPSTHFYEKTQRLFNSYIDLHKQIKKSYLQNFIKKKYLENFTNRCHNNNHPQKVTGNALIHIVNEILSKKNKIGEYRVQSIIEDFIQSQNFKNYHKKVDFSPQNKHCKKSKLLMKTMLTIIDGHSEDI